MTMNTTRLFLHTFAGMALATAFAVPAWAHGTGGGSASAGSSASAAAASGPGDAGAGGSAAGSDGGAGPSAPSRFSCFDSSIVAWRNTPECAAYAGEPIPLEWTQDRAFHERPSQAVDSAASGTSASRWPENRRQP